MRNATSRLKRELAERPEEYERFREENPSLPPTAEELLEKIDPGRVANFGLLNVFPKVLNNPKRREQIARMVWSAFDFSNTDAELLISDRPCSVFPALDDPRCLLVLPISPTLAFVATHSDSVASNLSLATLAERLNEAFPYQHFGAFGGTVVAISRTVFAPDELAAPVHPAVPVYRVVVSLDQQTASYQHKTYLLRPGLLLTADIVLEKRTLLEWLFEPIYAISNRQGSVQ